MAKKMETQAVEKGGLTPEIYLDYARRCMSSATVLAEAQSAHQAEMKRAKSAGVDTKALALVLKLRKQEPDETNIFYRNVARYAQWMGLPIGSQGSLFGATDDQQPTEKAKVEFDLSRAEDDGRFEGRAGSNRDDNPHVPGSEPHTRWDTGWLAGQKAIADEMAPPAKKATTRRQRRDPDSATA